MSPQEQNGAIAEADGWKPHPDGIHYYKGDTVPFSGKSLPNYLTDLNAMHEVEKHLTPRQAQHYISDLRNRCAYDGNWPECATAAQRAEAFLRTIGKWKD